MRLIAAHLRRAVFDAEDETARTMISYADYLAGLAFNSAGLGWIAGMTNAVCAEYIAAPASECAAVFLPHVLQYYGGGSETTRELFIDVAEALGCAGDGTEDVVDACVLATARLVADLKLPETLRELTARGKLRMHKKEIPRLALRALRDTAAVTAARGATLGEVESLFFCSWDTPLSKESC
jgi:alcohol dehydrogenase